jgi:hypothetical protein
VEHWELEFEWLRVRHLVQKSFGKAELPDLDAVLFLIGIQEIGRWQKSYTKEEKQDLMHVASCRLLSYDGYFEFVGRDADGWPHYQALLPFEVKGLEAQEELLKTYVIRYFKELEQENGGLERQ